MNINTTVNEILLPTLAIIGASEKEIELDAEIPEYFPDVKRIVKVDCTPFAEKYSFEGGKVNISGRAVFDVLYETGGKSKLKCCVFTKEFSVFAMLKEQVSESDIDCELFVSALSCDLLNSRKAIVRARIGGSVKATYVTPIKALGVSENDGIYYKQKEISFDGKPEYSRSDFKFSESVTLSHGEKNIGEIDHGEIRLSGVRTSFKDGRAEIKADADALIFYEDEDAGELTFTKKTIPISFGMQAKTDGSGRHGIRLEISEKEFTPELDRYGESRGIKVSFCVKATLSEVCTETQTVAEDVFERDFDGTPAFIDADLVYTSAEDEAPMSFDTTFIPEGQSVKEIFGCGVAKTIFSKDFAGENEKAKGSFAVAIFAGTENGIYEFQTSVPFEAEGENLEIISPEAEATLHGDGRINVRVGAVFKKSIRTAEHARFVSEITKRTEIKKGEKKPEFIFCFPTADETLWDIAKRYRVSPDAVAENNEKNFASGEHFKVGKPIFIKL